MTIEILCGDITALPSSDRAAELLPLSREKPLVLSCTDSDLKAAYTVLRTIMDYGYAHPEASHVRLVCADKDVYKSYRFQSNMWFAAHKPEHNE